MLCDNRQERRERQRGERARGDEEAPDGDKDDRLTTQDEADVILRVYVTAMRAIRYKRYAKRYRAAAINPSRTRAS